MSAHRHALPGQELDLYVSRWTREGFVKVGITKNQRWRKFINRGGVPLVVLRMAKGHATLLEAEAHAYLRECLECPFEWAREAEPFLRPAGGGYTECYTDDGRFVVPVILEIASRLYPGYERVAV